MMMKKNCYRDIAARAALSIVPMFLLALSFNSCNKDENKDKNKEQEHPKNTFIIDEVKKTVSRVTIQKGDLGSNFYNLRFYFSEKEKDNYILMQVGGEHHGGKTIDLKNKETKHNSFYWLVAYKENSKYIFYTIGNPEREDVVFQSGTLFVKRNSNTMKFEIKLENGKVKDDKKGDGNEHTVSLYYEGDVVFP